MNYFYNFDEELLEGVVLSRPNRFVALCDVEGEVVRAHCPVTGSIGGFDVAGMPCLLSKAAVGAKRSTSHTVEAISPWGINGGKMKWLGINQSRVNRYVEELFRLELLNFIPTVASVAMECVGIVREPKIGASKLDLLINDKLLVEVKTPLRNIYSSLPSDLVVSGAATAGTERMLRQLGDLTDWVNSGGKALLLVVFMYEADKFSTPKETNKIYSATARAVAEAGELGLDFYQINLEMDAGGVKFSKYFKL